MNTKTLAAALSSTLLILLGSNHAEAATLLGSQDFAGAASSGGGRGVEAGGASPRDIARPLPTGGGAAASSAPSVHQAPAPQFPSSQASFPSSSGAQSSSGQSASPSQAPSPSYSSSSSSSSSSATPQAPSVPRSGGRSSAASTVRSGVASQGIPSSETVPATDGKGVALVTTPANVWTADASWGWYNKYYFRGLDILDVVSPDDGGGVHSSRINIAYSRPNDAFLIGLGYVEALRPQQAAGAAGRGFARQDLFDIAPDSRYAETNLYLAYSRTLLPEKLMGTVGYNRYHFSDPAYWLGVSDSNEAFLRFDFLGIPLVHPSITYVNEFDGFEGSYLEARLEADFDLFTIGSTRVGLQPYVALSYDIEYNGTDQGWNAVEYGVNLPFRITDSVTVSLNANYTQGLDSTVDDLGRGPVRVPRVDPGFWGGVVVSGTWGNYGSSGSEELSFGSGKSAKAIHLPKESGDWEISVGSGWRSVSSTFEHGAIGRNAQVAAAFAALQSGGQGDLGTVGPGQSRVYDNGSVAAPGTGGAPSANVSEFTGGEPIGSTGSRQVVFTSEHFAHQFSSNAFSTRADDDDGVMFPYLQLDRELWASGPLSVRAGLLYSYTGAETDSGYAAARTDAAFKETSIHGFVYSVDEGVSGAGFGPGVYLVTEGVLAPQTTQLDITENAATFATFVNSRLDISAHDLAIPLELRYQLAERVHFEFSVAPTVTFVNSSIDTLVEVRKLDVDSRVVDASRNNFQQFGVVGGNATPVAEVPSANAPNEISPQGIAGSNSKNSGRYIRSQAKPGVPVATQRFSQSESDALFGAAAGAKLVLDLNDEGTWFLDIWGRYQHVDDLNVSNGVGSAEVDLSGWQIGSGIGIRF